MTLQMIPQGGKRAYPPRRSELTSYFWDQLAEGRFFTTRCGDCGKLTFPPKSFCPHCWSKKIQWTEIPTGGVVYTQTVVHIAPAIFAHEAPYRLCIVDLDVGIRVATRLVGDAHEVPVGSRVELVVLTYEDGPLFAVRPVETITGAK